MSIAQNHPSEIVLQTRELHRSFGGVQAVAGVNFSLRQGELRCLIGANGAGKSTFFKMLAGQIKPTSGSIHLFGRNVTHLAPFAIARMGVGVKTQVPNLFPGLSVHENLWLAARRVQPAAQATAKTEQAVDDMLARIQMQAQAKMPVTQLAHGHRQWLELGMILVTQPRLVLLDEPAAGMSAIEVERTVDLLKQEQKRGQCSFIVVEHDMHFISQIAHTVTVFHHGRILVEDELPAVLRNEQVRAAYLGARGGEAR